MSDLKRGVKKFRERTFRMNRPIRRVAFVAMLMFALLFANGTYVVLFQQTSLDATG